MKVKPSLPPRGQEAIDSRQASMGLRSYVEPQRMASPFSGSPPSIHSPSSTLSVPESSPGAICADDEMLEHLNLVWGQGWMMEDGAVHSLFDPKRAMEDAHGFFEAPFEASHLGKGVSCVTDPWIGWHNHLATASSGNVTPTIELIHQEEQLASSVNLDIDLGISPLPSTTKNETGTPSWQDSTSTQLAGPTVQALGTCQSPGKSAVAPVSLETNAPFLPQEIGFPNPLLPESFPKLECNNILSFDIETTSAPITTHRSENHANLQHNDVAGDCSADGLYHDDDILSQVHGTWATSQHQDGHFFDGLVPFEDCSIPVANLSGFSNVHDHCLETAQNLNADRLLMPLRDSTTFTCGLGVIQNEIWNSYTPLPTFAPTGMGISTVDDDLVPVFDTAQPTMSSFETTASAPATLVSGPPPPDSWPLSLSTRTHHADDMSMNHGNGAEVPALDSGPHVKDLPPEVGLDDHSSGWPVTLSRRGKSSKRDGKKASRSKKKAERFQAMQPPVAYAVSPLMFLSSEPGPRVTDWSEVPLVGASTTASETQGQNGHAPPTDNTYAQYNRPSRQVLPDDSLASCLRPSTDGLSEAVTGVASSNLDAAQSSPSAHVPSDIVSPVANVIHDHAMVDMHEPTRSNIEHPPDSQMVWIEYEPCLNVTPSTSNSSDGKVLSSPVDTIDNGVWSNSPDLITVSYDPNPHPAFSRRPRHKPRTHVEGEIVFLARPPSPPKPKRPRGRPPWKKKPTS